MDKVVVCSQLPRSRDWKQFDFKHINSYARWSMGREGVCVCVWHWGRARRRRRGGTGKGHKGFVTSIEEPPLTWLTKSFHALSSTVQ